LIIAVTPADVIFYNPFKYNCAIAILLF